MYGTRRLFPRAAEEGVDGIPSARVYNSGDIEINDSTWTVLTFDSERWDYGNIHSVIANTSRLTCRAAGVYLITAHVSWELLDSGTIRGVGILLNGTTYIARYVDENIPSVAVTEVQSCARLYELAVDDYVEMAVFQDTGGAFDAESVPNYSIEFAMELVP